jgi:hypothetical protein
MINAVHLSAIRLSTTRERQWAFMTDARFEAFAMPAFNGIPAHAQPERNQPPDVYLPEGM